ncbi:hypothetical protein GPALN_005094 [Globodera pallida]|nr:hypothetical protein GPALN_005094 [Globodera pallida]
MQFSSCRLPEDVFPSNSRPQGNEEHGQMRFELSRPVQCKLSSPNAADTATASAAADADTDTATASAAADTASAADTATASAAADTAAACLVCGEASNDIYFGAPACSACGSFFRRSVMGTRKYICRKGNKCAISSKERMRNSCRACRLKRCFEIGIVKSYHFQSSLARICFATLKMFPGQNQPLKHIIVNGCCLSLLNEQNYHFSPYTTHKEERMQYGAQLFKDIAALVSNFKPVEMTELELCAFLGIQFWNCIEKFVPLSAEQSARRNEFFVELHAMVAQRVGMNMAQIAIRFGQLLKLLLDTSTLAAELQETFAMVDIFFPPILLTHSNKVVSALLVA